MDDLLASRSCNLMQALEKELANFGKEKDKHIRNAQAKAKKAKADTEVSAFSSPSILCCLISILKFRDIKSNTLQHPCVNRKAVDVTIGLWSRHLRG